MKAARRPTHFWLGLLVLVLGLAILAIVFFFFFSTWYAVLAAEAAGAGVALLAVCILLMTGVWHAEPVRPGAPADTTTVAEALPETSPAVGTAPADEALAAPAPPAGPASVPTPEPAPTPDPLPTAAADTEPPEASATAAPEAEAASAPADIAARPKSELPKQNGHAVEASIPTSPADDETVVSRPSLTDLPQSYPRPSQGYSLDVEAEDLSQLLGDVAEQTVIVLATRGKRGIERRERMASKIDTFSQEMAVDPDYAPVVAYLESISALLRAGKPIPATQALVDPFDGLYRYVLVLIRRKTGMTHDE